MTDAALEAVLRRDRAIVTAALFVLAALAWAYVLWLAVDMDMGDMDMSGFRMNSAGTALMTPTTAPWNATEFAFVFAMWAVMMVGMMTPSATPMILIYARVGRQAAQQGKPFAASSWFAGGYLLAWVGFALVATFAQWALERGSYAENGSREWGPQRHRADCSRSLSVDSAQGRLPVAMPDATAIHSASRRVSP